MSKENITAGTEDATMTKEEKNAEIRKYEDDILAGLLEAANYKNDEEDTVKIKIKRHGAIVLEFRIRPLSEDEYQNCRKKNTNYKRNRQSGTRVAESLEVARYRSQLIYEATVDEDREKIWDNRAAWNKLNVLNGIDLVEVVLKAGEKDAILEKLDEISGYQPNVEEVVKN
jgi:hypothetical protein|nr:MAG: XkdN-like tail assembly chaperone protein [Bacteriophage sp.]